GPNQVPHQDGTYDFTYESWVRKSQQADHYDFGRCVQNNGSVEMYVDWKNTQVIGWARPKDRVYAQVDSLSPEFDLLDTDLWYRSKPERINAPYREVKKPKSISPGKLRSTVEMPIPTDSERGVSSLVAVLAQFTSEISSGPEGYTYTYGWRDD